MVAEAVRVSRGLLGDRARLVKFSGGTTTAASAARVDAVDATAAAGKKCEPRHIHCSVDRRSFAARRRSAVPAWAALEAPGPLDDSASRADGGDTPLPSPATIEPATPRS
jgi:hypothetical protein